MVAVHQLYTVDDLDAMPDDGMRREIIAGELFVNPAPRIRHQVVLSLLVARLSAFFADSGAFLPLPAPVELRITPHDAVQPDLVVLPASFARNVGLQRSVETPPPLVAEILSPSTSRVDRRAKMALYARFGVPEYWIIDPERFTFEAYRLLHQTYVRIDSDERGDVRSAVFPGFVMPVEAFFAELRGDAPSADSDVA